MAPIVNFGILEEKQQFALLIEYARDFYAWLSTIAAYDQIKQTPQMVAIKNSNWCYWYRLIAITDQMTAHRARRQWVDHHLHARIPFATLCAELGYFHHWLTEKAMLNETAVKALHKTLRVDVAYFAQRYAEAQIDQHVDVTAQQDQTISAITHQFARCADFDFSLQKTALFSGHRALDRALVNLMKTMQKLVDFARCIAKEEFISQDDSAACTNQLGALLLEIDRSAKANAHNKAMISAKTSLVRELMLLASGAQNIKMLAHQAVSVLCKHINAAVGTFYRVVSDGDEKTLQILGGFAVDKSRRIGEEISLRHAYLGPVIANRRTVFHQELVDSPYILDVGFAKVRINNLVLIPIVIDDEVFGVVELGSPKPFTSMDLEVLNEISATLTPLLKSHRNRERIRILIEESKVASLRLSAQRAQLLRQQQALTFVDESMH